MAEVLPFRGILYDTSKISSLADVITPPFDVISSKEQDLFYERSPHNMVRLILGKSTPYDTRGHNPHSRAAEYLGTWIEKGIFARDSAPALYLTRLDFTVEQHAFTRIGLIALARLVPFEAGVILPHERTFTNVKSERLSLMKACHANFSPIFAMVPDDDQALFESMRRLAADLPPDVAFTAHDGCGHRLWRLSDGDVSRRLCGAMQSKKIYIADGHHRYETALNYRDWLRDCLPNFSEEHPANFVMMYLCSMADPGLVIRPAHRMLSEMPPEALDRLGDRLEDYFKVVKIEFREDERETVLAKALDSLQHTAPQRSIGMYLKGRRAFYVLTRKAGGAVDALTGPDLSGPLKDLDVTILTRLIFVESLGFDQARLDNEKLIAYSTDAAEAIDGVNRGAYDACFILNPTSVSQVRQVADCGLVMPRKATYFYPKVTTGLVINAFSS